MCTGFQVSSTRSRDLAEQIQGSARWGLRPDLFRPSPNRATFQAPPSVAEERGGSAAGDICPPANEQTQGSARWGLRPDLFRPSPNRATFQAPPSVAEERGGSAAGDICPPPRISLYKYRFDQRGADASVASYCRPGAGSS